MGMTESVCILCTENRNSSHRFEKNWPCFSKHSVHSSIICNRCRTVDRPFKIEI